MMVCVVEGVSGSSVRFATAYVCLRGEGMKKEGKKDRETDEKKHELNRERTSQI